MLGINTVFLTLFIRRNWDCDFIVDTGGLIGIQVKCLNDNASQVRGRDGSAAMLAAKRSAGVTPEVNLREHVTCMPLPSVNKAAHFGFEARWDVTRSPKQAYQWPH